jgi:hypothetical protein
VLRKNEASNKESKWEMGLKKEGSYKLIEAHEGGSYKLETVEGKAVPRK